MWSSSSNNLSFTSTASKLSLSFTTNQFFREALLELVEELVMYLVFSYLLPTTARLSIILQGLPSSKTVTISGYITTHLKDLLMPLGIFHEAEVGAAFLCPLPETQHFLV